MLDTSLDKISGIETALRKQKLTVTVILYSAAVIISLFTAEAK